MQETYIVLPSYRTVRRTQTRYVEMLNPLGMPAEDLRVIVARGPSSSLLC